MSTYAPQIFTNNSQGLQVTMNGALSYAEFLYMLGTLNFNVQAIFIESTTNAQVNGPYQFTKYDSTGISDGQVLKPRVEPYQYQPSVELVPPNGPLLLNGLSYMTFNLAAGLSISLRLFSTESSFLNVGKNNVVDNFGLITDPLGNRNTYLKTRFTRE
jgi:hypothetical protein